MRYPPEMVFLAIYPDNYIEKLRDFVTNGDDSTV